MGSGLWFNSNDTVMAWGCDCLVLYGNADVSTTVPFWHSG